MIPKPLSKWGLSSIAQQKVKKELWAWLDLFIKQADGQQGNVFRADFVNDKFFYFTNCNDILAKDPECKAIETNPKIGKRKQKVLLQLFVRALLGENLTKVLKCSHCGFEGEIINSTVNGHYRYCPKCKKIGLVGYVPTMSDSLNDTMIQIANTTQVTTSPLVDEMKQLKYRRNKNGRKDI